MWMVAGGGGGREGVLCHGIPRGGLRLRYILEGSGRQKGHLKSTEYFLWRRAERAPPSRWALSIIERAHCMQLANKGLVFQANELILKL